MIGRHDRPPYRMRTATASCAAATRTAGTSCGIAGDHQDDGECGAAGAEWVPHRGGLSERPKETVLKTVGAVATPSPGVRIPRPPHLALRTSTNGALTREYNSTASRPPMPVTARVRPCRTAGWGTQGARWGTQGARGRMACAADAPTPGGPPRAGARSTVAAPADDGCVTDTTVVRWRRYGKDRLYVNGPAGERYGWGDLLTGAIEVTAPGQHDLVKELVCAHPAWASRGGASGPGADSPDHVIGPPPVGDVAPAERVVERTPPAASTKQPWLDLALNRPGQGARGQAVELREAAPVRTLVARLVGAHTDERAWRIGADGEESVARELARLGDGWLTLHSVPVGRNGADIDHVLIGPGGVFTINAKNHSGARVWVGGDTVMIGQTRGPYVRNARFEAARAGRLLSAAVGQQVNVMGIVAMMCDDITIKRPPGDVLVIGSRRLRKWLGGLGPSLTGDQVDAVFDRARRSTTWQPS